MAERPSISGPICDALLFLSRPHIPEHDRVLARELCTKVEDWSLLIDTAQRKFSLPFIFRNMQSLDLDDDFDPVLEKMHAQVLPGTFAALRVLATQQKFHELCIAPLGVEHVYLKGPSLAVRYYKDPGQRFARDIDILVSRADQERIARHATENGYLILDEETLKGRTFNQRDLQALLKYKTVITLVTSDNIIIEVHRNIDKRLGLFKAEEVFARRETTTYGDARYGVMPTTDLFCYVCYHNTRHIWSRLHWIADLDAMITHPSFDEADVLERASVLGLRANVEACLEFHRIAISGDASARAKTEGRGAELAAICLKNLSGDLDLEYELREGEELLGLPFTWMVSKDIRQRARTLTRLSRILPSYQEYAAWPLPGALQWIYYLSKPLAIVRRHLLPQRKQDAGS